MDQLDPTDLVHLAHQGGPKGSREWTTRTMRCRLGYRTLGCVATRRGEFLA